MRNPMDSQAAHLAARWADLCLACFFTIFLLWPGLEGYANISQARHICFFILAIVTISGTVIICTARRTPAALVSDFRLPHLLAVLLLVWLMVCTAFSPYKEVALAGAGRREGFWTLALYLGLFWCFSQFGRMGRLHYLLLAVSMLLMDGLIFLQLLGRNPLGLYPQGLTFYHRFIAYGGEYLGTIGNSDLLSAVLCLVIPLLLLCPLGGRQWALCRAAGALTFLALLGSEVQGGLVGILGGLALALPVTLWQSRGHRSVLQAIAIALGCMGLASLVQYRFEQEELAIFLAFTWKAPLLLAGAALTVGLSFFLKGGKKQAIALCALYGAGVLGVLIFLWTYTGGNATLRGLGLLLRGQAPDTLGSSRIAIWREALELIAHAPWLGSGPDTYGLRSRLLFTRTLPSGYVVRTSVDAAHNEYLNLAVNCGLPAMICHLALLGSTVAVAIRSQKAETLPLWTAVSCYSIQALFGISQTVSAPLFWVLLGLCCGAGQKGSTVHAKI